MKIRVSFANVSDTTHSFDFRQTLRTSAFIVILSCCRFSWIFADVSPIALLCNFMYICWPCENISANIILWGTSRLAWTTTVHEPYILYCCVFSDIFWYTYMLSGFPRLLLTTTGAAPSSKFQKLILCISYLYDWVCLHFSAIFLLTQAEAESLCSFQFMVILLCLCTFEDYILIKINMFTSYSRGLADVSRAHICTFSLHSPCTWTIFIDS